MQVVQIEAFVCCAIRFVERMVRQPSYAMNGLRYAQWAIRDFVRRRWPRPDVLMPRAKPLRGLLVVLRTSDFVQHCSSSRGLECIGINDKLDVVKRCGASFVKAANRFRAKHGVEALRVVLVEDRLSEAGRSVYLGAAPLEEVPSEPGNRETFQKQVDVALHADDETLVCFLEDDYLLDPDVFCEAFELFNATSVSGFTPHFHPGLVNGETKVRLVFANGKFYAHVPSDDLHVFHRRLGRAQKLDALASLLRIGAWQHQRDMAAQRLLGALLPYIGRTHAQVRFVFCVECLES